MSTTVADFLTNHVRTKLNEPTARKWQDAELKRYASEAQRRFAAELGKYGESGYFESEQTVAVSADTEAAALPATFGGVKGEVMWIRGSDSKRFPIPKLDRKNLQRVRDDTDAVSGNATSPRGWFLRGANLHVIPTHSSGWSISIMQRDVPAELASGNMGVDDRFLEVISLDTCLMAIGKNERADHDWARERRAAMSGIIDELGLRDDETYEDQVESVHYDAVNSEGYEPYWDYSP